MENSVINTGTLAILVIIVTAACGLGYMLGRCLWSAYRGWKPSYIYCARCNKLMGLKGLQTPPYYVPQIMVAEKSRPDIQIVTSNGRQIECNESATYRRLGMKESVSNIDVRAKQLESRILSPVQESPQTAAARHLTSRVERLTPSPTPFKQKEVSQAGIHTPASYRSTPESTDHGHVFVEETSVGENTELLYDYDKNNQVRLLTDVNVAKTPGNASSKRPLRPSGSIKSRRSLIMRAPGEFNNRGNTSNSVAVRTEESELDPSEAESRTPLLGNNNPNPNYQQSSKSVRNRGSPGNTSDMAAQLTKLTNIHNIDIESGARQEPADKKHQHTRTLSKKIRKTASIRTQTSTYKQSRYVDSDFTSQSEDERGRCHLKMGALFHKPSEEIREIVAHNELQTYGSIHHQTQTMGQTLRVGGLNHITTRKAPNSPQISNLPIVDHQQLITMRAPSPVDEDRQRMEESLHKDLSSNIDFESFKLSPDKSEISSHLPTSSDNSRVQSTSPQFLMMDKHLDIGHQVLDQELTSSGVHSGQSAATSVCSLSSSRNVAHPQHHLDQPGFAKNHQVVRNTQHPAISPALAASDLTPHHTSKKSVPWNGEVNIPYPSLSPTENPYETDSPSNRTTGSNKSAQQAHVQLTKLVKERSLPDASNTFIPEIDCHVSPSSLPGYTPRGARPTPNSNTERAQLTNQLHTIFHQREATDFRNPEERVRLHTNGSQQSGCSEETLKGSQSSQGLAHSVNRPGGVIVRSPSSRPAVPAGFMNSSDNVFHEAGPRGEMSRPPHLSAEPLPPSGIQHGPTNVQHRTRLGTNSSAGGSRSRVESLSSVDQRPRRGTESSQPKSLDWDEYYSDPQFLKDDLVGRHYRDEEIDTDDLFGDFHGEGVVNQEVVDGGISEAGIEAVLQEMENTQNEQTSGSEDVQDLNNTATEKLVDEGASEHYERTNEAPFPEIVVHSPSTLQPEILSSCCNNSESSRKYYKSTGQPGRSFTFPLSSMNCKCKCEQCFSAHQPTINMKEEVRSKSGTQTPINSNRNFNFCNFRTKSASDQTALTHTTYCAQKSRLQQNTSNTAESVNTKRYSHSSSPLKQSNAAHSQNISDLPNNFPGRLITNAYGNLSQHSAQGTPTTTCENDNSSQHLTNFSASDQLAAENYSSTSDQLAAENYTSTSDQLAAENYYSTSDQLAADNTPSTYVSSPNILTTNSVSGQSPNLSTTYDSSLISPDPPNNSVCSQPTNNQSFIHLPSSSAGGCSPQIPADLATYSGSDLSETFPFGSAVTSARDGAESSNLPYTQGRIAGPDISADEFPPPHPLVNTLVPADLRQLEDIRLKSTSSTDI